MKYADLHIHTFYSDSTHSPEEILNLAKQFNLDCIAITDHDTVDGINPILSLSATCEVIAGIELSAERKNKEIHILGYFINWQDKDFCQRLEKIKEIRRERIYKFADKLKSFGIKIEPEEVIKQAGCASVGRLHLAKYLVEKGYVKSTLEAFKRYIGDLAKAYVSAFRLNPSEAISIIRKVGGIAVLAHPHTVSNNQELIPELVGYGLMGLEVYYPEYDEFLTNYYKMQAKKYGLLITGGSDCHGKAKNEILMGKVKIPYELVEELKIAHHNLIKNAK